MKVISLKLGRMTHHKIEPDEERFRAFLAFLGQVGKELPPCSGGHWRFDLPDGIATITPAKKGDGYQLSPPCHEAWKTFLAQTKPTPQPKPGTRKEKRFERLAARDGAACFYCGEALSAESATIEHLLARAHHGPGRLENLVLSCRSCNKRAGNLPVAEKIRTLYRPHVSR